MLTFIKEFEQYLLSENRAETLQSVIPGSQADIYIQLTSSIKSMTEENKLPDNIWTILQQFKEKVSTNVYNENKLVIILREYDLNVTSEARKKQIIKEIKEMFYAHVAEFNYHKPQNIQNKGLENEYFTTKYPNELDEKLFELKPLVEEYIKNPSNTYILQEIREEFLYPAIEGVFERLPNKFFEDWLLRSEFTLPTYQLSKENLEIVAKFINNYCNNSKYSIELTHLYSGMTVEQIQYLSEMITSQYFDMNEIINQIISKKFSSRLNPSASIQEKIQVLFQIYELVKNQPAKFNAFKASVLLEILEKEDLLNVYDIKLFLEYLKNPCTANSIYNLSGEKYKSISSQRQYDIWRNNKLPKENPVISSHLKHFFLKEKTKLETFSDYLEANYLKREYYKSRMLLGEESEEFIKFFDKVEYESLIKKTEITLCQYNKPLFDVDEPVILDIDLKNIQTLFVKVFEINAENYYYSKKAQINTAISLEGLITTFESTYSYNEKPQRLATKTFELTEISNKRGLYIVEFIGNGYSSRAIIKKGRLSLVSRSTTVGKMLFVLNEKSEICKSEKTGVWFKDTFYKCDIQTGHISIPYMKQNYNEQCILVHEDFAELSNLEVTEEIYELRGAFHINNESLMLGNTAKVLFKPFLYINGRETGVEYLKNCKITAKLTKLENDASIPIINNFDKLIVNRDKEIEIELQIPPKLIKIELLFEAEIKNKSKDKNDNLKFSHFIDLNSVEEDRQFSKLFMRKVSDDYIVSLLGKNGEAKANAQIEFEFELKTTSKKSTAILQTDQQGEVKLGKLAYVTLLNARTNCMDKEIIMQWTVPSHIKFSYPNSIDIVEGEKISLPYDNSQLKQSNVSLVKKGKGEIIENCFDKIKLVAVNSDNTRYKISIENLHVGSYQLNLVHSEQVVNITVHQGKIWENKIFIITREEIIENTQNRDPISIDDIAITQSENEETLSDIHIKLGAYSSQARIHLYAYQFLPSDTYNFSKKIKSIYHSAQFKTVHSFQNWKNIYLSNRLLNEEIQYVFDRKHLERVMGNSLVKPSLLLKRKFIRETTTEEETINIGTEYSSELIGMHKESALLSKKKLRCLEKKKLNKMVREDYSDFHNFLAYSPIIITNITPNNSGDVVIKNLPLSKFSHIQVIAIDKQSICDEIVSLPAKEILKRNLTLLTPLNPEKTYSEIRKIECIGRSSPVEIADITSTDYKIIDSLEKVLNYNLLVNPNFSKDWEKFSFLFKLNEMKEEEQKKNISNYFSHELNIFCYFKYPSLFEKFILPVIKYKCEKTFIDLFLLNDVDNLIKHTRPDCLSKLNAFEKSLLVLALGKSNPDLANNVKNLIYTIADKNKLKGQDMKKLFNIMMNMKIAKENEYISQERLKRLVPVSYLDGCENMMFNNQSALMQPAGLSSYPSARGGGGSQFGAQQQSIGQANNFRSSGLYSNKEYLREEEDLFEHAENEECEDNNQMIQNAKNNLYTNPGKSGEYQETHYYLGKNDITLENHNLFWYDFVSHLNSKYSNENFLSKNIIIPANNVIDLIFTLAVLDLPFTASSHQFERKEGRALQINPASNIVLFTKEIAEAKSNLTSKLMMAQNVIDIANENNPEQVHVKEFLLNKVYVHETIITNISSKKLSFELIIQIPVSSIPVMSSEYTKTVQLQLDKFDTTNYKTYFYFPDKIGKFIQYPPNVAIDGIVVSKGEALTYEVVHSISFQSKENLDNILVTGSKKDILEYFQNCENIKIDLVNKVLWLLKEKDFFFEFLQILRKKGIFLESVWYFGFLHQDPTSVREILDVDRRIKQAVGPKFNSSLLKVDDTNNFDVKFHLDYHPIFNARVHRLGQNNKAILNKEQRETYENFIIYLLRLSEKEIDSKCYIRLCYYLILQDRIEEALKIFTRIDTTEFNTNSSLLMQYDYIAAYLDFSIGYPDFKIAKDICVKYKNFPLTHWRDMFEEIEDQLIEYEGKEICSEIDLNLDDEKKKQMVKNVIQSQPSLGFTIESKSTLNISYSNLDYIWIKFYLIDLEILFSRTPFISSNLDDFSFVQPNYVKKIELDNSSKEKAKDYLFAIPEEFLSKNIFIEVSSLSKKAFDTYFSTRLKVLITENLGEIKVTDLDNKQLNKVYVKVFAKMKDNAVKFYKDGYTDLRGKFNYIQLNTDQLKSVTKFAVFIMHDVYGSIIKECDPPTNIARDENNNLSDYDNFDNYRKQARQVWRTKNKEQC